MTITCNIPSCKNEAKVSGLCMAHYLRVHRYGRVNLIVDKSGLKNIYKKEHNSYRAMKNRCLCKTDRNYQNWGGKGIKICQRWLEKPNGFVNFLNDMGPRPDGTTLDRIDNTKGYSPENCRWASAWTQAANSSRLIGRIPGVHFIKNRGKWEANIKFGNIRKTKSFPTEKEAIQQRKQWEKIYCASDKEA